MGQAVRAIDPDEFSAPFLGVSRSAKGLIWRERLDAKDQSTAVAISQRFDLPELLGRVLAGRGVAVDDAETFLEPTIKELMPDPSSTTSGLMPLRRMPLFFSLPNSSGLPCSR